MTTIALIIGYFVIAGLTVVVSMAFMTILYALFTTLLVRLCPKENTDD